jgi:cytochrome P450
MADLDSAATSDALDVEGIDFATVDFFRGNDLVVDPYPYFDYLREQCPVQPESRHNVMMVTGYEEAVAIYGDTASFSSCNSVTGPFPGFKDKPEGPDVTDLTKFVAEHRGELPFWDQLPTMDPPEHKAHRALLMRLLTPSRLRENEEFMWANADRQIDEFIDKGTFDLVTDFGGPFTLYVIADLLGVPAEDQDWFRNELQGGGHKEERGGIGSTNATELGHTPLEFLYERFTDYINDRRKNPREDVMTGLATATFPDGSLPEVIDVVRIAVNLFGAGQETTVRLLGAAFQLMAERPELQQFLRENPDRVPDFVEECLRFESPVKGDFRLAKKATTVGGVDIPVGTTVMVVNGAGNRDPRQFECPEEFRIDRKNSRTNLAFGRGVHACPGGPLARVEAIVTVRRLLERMSNITISEEHHGPAGARNFSYSPTYVLRGLNHLYLDFTAAS